MKYLKLFLVLFSVTVITLLFSCSTDSNGSDSTNETFGDWVPLFTNQSENFTQTRIGSLGTQESRTISVTSQSNTTESSEENENIDVNEDGDLFDFIEIIETTYTSSSNLGSFSSKSYTIKTDNDMVLKVGNSEYEISNGIIENFGLDDGSYGSCDKYSGHLHELTLYSSEGSLDSNGNLIGNGREIYFVLFSSTYNSLDVGTYTFDDMDLYYDYNTNECIEDHTFQIQTFNSGDYQINRENNNLLNFSSGSIIVSKTENTYTITFEGDDTNNTDISFFYKGSLSFYDKS